MDPHEKNPPTVDKLTNQLNTVAAPEEMFINAKSAGKA
jgi:hypothetical protein